VTGLSYRATANDPRCSASGVRRTIRCEETLARGAAMAAKKPASSGKDWTRSEVAAEEGVEVQHAHPRGRATPEADT